MTGNSFGIVELLLWHHRDELGRNARLQYYCDLARKEMADCRIPPDFLTGLFDYDAWQERKPLPYGTLIYYFRNNLGEMHLPDLATLDRDRASVGLGPIEEFARRMEVPFEALPIGR
ncbi:MAG: hypothetical protein QM724_09290 [Flavobacteriales bacterium]